MSDKREEEEPRRRDYDLATHIMRVQGQIAESALREQKYKEKQAEVALERAEAKRTFEQQKHEIMLREMQRVAEHAEDQREREMAQPPEGRPS